MWQPAALLSLIQTCHLAFTGGSVRLLLTNRQRSGVATRMIVGMPGSGVRGQDRESSWRLLQVGAKPVCGETGHETS
jgi:hypothetical protein